MREGYPGSTLEVFIYIMSNLGGLNLYWIQWSDSFPNLMPGFSIAVPSTVINIQTSTNKLQAKFIWPFHPINLTINKGGALVLFPPKEKINEIKNHPANLNRSFLLMKANVIL